MHLVQTQHALSVMPLSLYSILKLQESYF